MKHNSETDHSKIKKSSVNYQNLQTHLIQAELENKNLMSNEGEFILEDIKNKLDRIYNLQKTKSYLINEISYYLLNKNK